MRNHVDEPRGTITGMTTTKKNPWTGRRVTLEEEDKPRTECHPDTVNEDRAAAAADADVGVLVGGGGCGAEEICVSRPDLSSSLGGICWLPYGDGMVCDSSSPFYDPACDCSAFNVPTTTGFISCLLSNETMGSSYYGCYHVREVTTRTKTFEDGIYRSGEFCTELVVGGDDIPTAHSTKVCVASNGSSCHVQMDGQACTACTYTLDLSIITSPGGVNTMADCSNVVEGLVMTEFKNFATFPIIQACSKPVVNNGTVMCDLCPGGRVSLLL